VENGGQEPAMRFLENNLINAVIPLMKVWSENAHTLQCCMFVVTAVLETTDKKGMEIITNKITITEGITIAFEEHGRSTANSFFLTCQTMRSCFHPGIEWELGEALKGHIVQCICGGILVHQQYDDDAQNVSRKLLYRLVGPEKAKEMISCIEMPHGPNALHAAAA
jgi:hypothetical protein